MEENWEIIDSIDNEILSREIIDKNTDTQVLPEQIYQKQDFNWRQSPVFSSSESDDESARRSDSGNDSETHNSPYNSDNNSDIDENTSLLEKTTTRRKNYVDIMKTIMVSCIFLISGIGMYMIHSRLINQS